MRKFTCVLALALMVSLGFSAMASGQAKVCQKVGGVLMTNVGAIDGEYNLGPVFGDLSGSVAAKLVSASAGTFTFQHYWITSTGDAIFFKPAVLHPTYPTDDPNIIAVPWGHYIAEISGGTGKYEEASGSLSCLGMADLNPKKSTLVLRFAGDLCYPVTQTNPSKH